jgi:hypothetical protein
MVEYLIGVALMTGALWAVLDSPASILIDALAAQWSGFTYGISRP